VSLEWQLRGILQASDEVDISCPEVSTHEDLFLIEWHGARRWVMTFAIAKDEVAYSMLLGEKSAKGRWGLNELIPDEVKALMYEYRDHEDAQVSAFHAVEKLKAHAAALVAIFDGKQSPNRELVDALNGMEDALDALAPTETPPVKSPQERAEAFRAMVQRWKAETPEGYDEEVMAVLRSEMPHKFKEPSDE
jgi:hypothetical protein